MDDDDDDDDDANSGDVVDALILLLEDEWICRVVGGQVVGTTKAKEI
jgi:hypothetical protein